MPRYKATARGFMFGRLYGPGLKRPIVHTEKLLKPVPSWLKLMPEETAAAKKKREAVAKKEGKADAEKLKQDKVDIDSVTFTEAAGATSANVETL